MNNPESGNKGLESLLVWKKSLQFAVFINKTILPTLPEAEKYALVSQLRRSAQSISANISEGYGRYYFQEGIRFTYIARGSLEETYNHLSYAREMEYISETDFKELEIQINEIRKLTNGFISYLKKSKRGISEPGSNYYVEPDTTYE